MAWGVFVQLSPILRVLEVRRRPRVVIARVGVLLIYIHRGMVQPL